MLIPTMNPVLIAAAVIPAAVLFWFIYKSDRAEKEPLGMLLSLVFFGIISTLLALAAEKLGTLILDLLFRKNSLIYALLLYFVVVAISEEGFKYLLLRWRTWRSAEFNYQFDGIVYAVAVSLGFALWENLSYVAIYGLSTALIRAVTAVPGHACFGVFMGAWYGFAKKYDKQRNHALSRLCRFLALLIPVLLHGTYDFIASLESGFFSLIFVVFVAAMFVVAFITVRRRSKRDRYIG